MDETGVGLEAQGAGVRRVAADGPAGGGYRRTLF